MQEEKAFFVDVDVYSESDYLIAFADCQKLQRLRRKMIKCKEVLDCCLEVASGCKQHWKDVHSQEDKYIGEDATNAETFFSRIKVHRRGIQALLEHADGTATLVQSILPQPCSKLSHLTRLLHPSQLSQILNYRNEDMLVKSNDALRRSSDAMREIALAAKAENELISALMGKFQRDSHAVKILTYIALIYLPASLVAVSPFNSAIKHRKKKVNLLSFVLQGNLQFELGTDQKQQCGGYRFPPRYVQVFLVVSLHHTRLDGADVPADCGITVSRAATAVDDEVSRHEPATRLMRDGSGEHRLPISDFVSMIVYPEYLHGKIGAKTAPCSGLYMDHRHDGKQEWWICSQIPIRWGGVLKQYNPTFSLFLSLSPHTNRIRSRIAFSLFRHYYTSQYLRPTQLNSPLSLHFLQDEANCLHYGEPRFLSSESMNNALMFANGAGNT